MLHQKVWFLGRKPPTGLPGGSCRTDAPDEDVQYNTTLLHRAGKRLPAGSSKFLGRKPSVLRQWCSASRAATPSPFCGFVRGQGLLRTYRLSASGLQVSSLRNRTKPGKRRGLAPKTGDVRHWGYVIGGGLTVRCLEQRGRGPSAPAEERVPSARQCRSERGGKNLFFQPERNRKSRPRRKRAVFFFVDGNQTNSLFKPSRSMTMVF